MKLKLIETPSSGRVWVAERVRVNENGYWRWKWRAIAGFASETCAITMHPTAKWRGDFRTWESK